MTESSASRNLRRAADPVGRFLTDAFHFIGLFAIGGATAWAAFFAFVGMLQKGHATIDDLLLLFIYLEIGSMVGIYFRTNHMPVRFLVYVGITAITRHLIVYVQDVAEPSLGIIYLSGATLILAAAVFVIRFTSFHYPSRSETESGPDVKTD